MIDHRQKTKENLIAELKEAGATVKGNAVRCPFHPDTHPSGGIFQGKDGVWRFKCQACGAGGDAFDIKSRRIGRPLAEILKENAQDKPQMKNSTTPTPQAEKMTFASLEAVYAHLAKRGGALEALHAYPDDFFMVRWRVSPDKKEMRPLVRQQDGRFVMAFPDGQRPLYRRDDLADAKTVVITEGEAKADVLSAYGFMVSTSSGGSKAAGKTDWRPLAGKNIIIWPDYDTAGKQYADDVRRILEEIGCAVKIIDPAGLDLAEGEDAADYVQQLKNAGFDDFSIKENLTRVFARAKSIGVGQEVVQVLTAIGAGQYEPIETGFHTLDDEMQILPGSLNLICGSPGSSKSLLMLQLAAVWHKQKIKTAVFELEKDRVFHLRRALAQEAGMAVMTNNHWVKENAEFSKKIAIEHLEFLDGFGRMIFACPEKMVYQKDVIEWTQQRAEAGCRVVIIDPATKAERQDEPYKADSQFVQQLAQIATMTRLVIFLVLHPSKTVVSVPDLSQIAGGAAYGRFADNAVWLESHDQKSSQVKTCCGNIECEHNRTLWILKSRDGGGTGTRIAFQFKANNLTLNELGRIVKKQKNKCSVE